MALIFGMNTPNLRLWLGSSLWRAAIANRRTSQYWNWRNRSMRNYELTGLTKSDDHFVRTIESCRLDLCKWGIGYGTNKMLPYFLGHKRLVVVEHRERFIKCFFSREDSYYRISGEESPSWIILTSSSPVILICKLNIRLFAVFKPFFFLLSFSTRRIDLQKQ